MTNSRSFTVATWERTRRAMAGHAVIESATITGTRPCPMSPMMRTASRMSGKANIPSVKRRMVSRSKAERRRHHSHEDADGEGDGLNHESHEQRHPRAGGDARERVAAKFVRSEPKPFVRLHVGRRDGVDHGIERPACPVVEHAPGGRGTQGRNERQSRRNTIPAIMSGSRRPTPRGPW